MKLNIYKDLQQEMLVCNRCGLGKDLLDGQDPHVIGQGNLDAKIIFCAEAPGFNETITKQPLTGAGKSGTVYEDILEKLKLKREDVYTTNLLICRPPNNREPELFEIEQCGNFLKSEIKLINPKLIVSFGRFSTKYLLGNVKITQVRGKLIKSSEFNIDVFPMYHPSFVASYASQEKRKEFKRDIQILRRIVKEL